MWSGRCLLREAPSAEAAELPGEPVDENIRLEGISGVLSKHGAPEGKGIVQEQRD